MPNETRAQAQAALKQANRASKNGDLAAAERWSKVAERLVAAAEREAALPAPVDDYEETERLRAELRRRIIRLGAASQTLEAWEAERELYEANFAAALANGTEPPEPLRPHPYGERSHEAVLTNFLTGPEPDDGLVA